MSERDGIGRLYLRVAALGLLWCALGLGLGVILAIRLHAVQHDAISLSTDRLPTALAVQRMDEKLAHTEALAHRLVVEHTLDKDTSASSARLLEILAALDSAIAGVTPDALDEFDRASVIDARTHAAAVASSSRSLLGTLGKSADHAAVLDKISDDSARADVHLERLHEQTLTPALTSLAAHLEAQSRRLAAEAMITGAVAFALGTVLTIIVARLVWGKEHEQANDRRRQEFQSRLTDALGMADGETETFQLMEEVVELVAPGVPCELHLADSSHAHFSRVAVAGGAPAAEPMCAVRSPSCCPAVRRGSTISFTNSDEFDACPHLRGRTNGACGASCVPLSVMGQHVGVLHVVTAANAPLDDATIQRLTVLAAKSGERIGVLRAFAQSEQQAARDPLTGLLNRRSLESEVQRLQRSGTAFCIAYADIDHFKRLNDTHGHETGDKALRLFSRVMRESLRPGDVVARWGGEEFVLLLPSLELSGARVALDRVREAIAEASGGGTVPRFTVSIGVTRCAQDDDFFERLDEADAALLAAKGAGRNCVIGSESGVTMPSATRASRESVPATAGTTAKAA